MTVIGVVAVASVLVAASGAWARCIPLYEVSAEESGAVSVYKKAPFAFQVRTETASGKVVVQQPSGTSCETSVDGLSRIYLAPGNIVALRSMQVASDDIYFIDAGTCKARHADVSLSGLSRQKIKAKLNQAGFCLDH